MKLPYTELNIRFSKLYTSLQGHSKDRNLLPAVPITPQFSVCSLEEKYPCYVWLGDSIDG